MRILMKYLLTVQKIYLWGKLITNDINWALIYFAREHKKTPAFRPGFQLSDYLRITPQ